jgi:hypothetical protein
MKTFDQPHPKYPGWRYETAFVIAACHHKYRLPLFTGRHLVKCRKAFLRYHSGWPRVSEEHVASIFTALLATGFDARFLLEPEEGGDMFLRRQLTSRYYIPLNSILQIHSCFIHDRVCLPGIFCQ